MDRQALIANLKDVRQRYNIMREGCEPNQVDRYVEAQIASQQAMMSMIDDVIDALSRKFPMRLRRDIHATYVEEVDCTVVWQYIYLEEERHGQPDLDHEPVQTTILGWYHGEPEDDATEHFSCSTLVADYYTMWGVTINEMDA